MIRKVMAVVLLCLSSAMSAQFISVPISELNTMDVADVVLVDVRAAEEYDEAHLCDALNMDVKAVDFKEKIKNVSKESTILLYCKTGVRSENAAKILSELGYENIVNLEGGITAYIAQGGMPCESHSTNVK